MNQIEQRSGWFKIALFAALTLGGCASMQGREPIQVTVADVESLAAEGLELRMMVKLRVQNPNDTSLEYRGVYVQLDVQDKTFATGVSDEPGSIPPFSEALVKVPVTVSFVRLAGHAISRPLPALAPSPQSCNPAKTLAGTGR